MTLKGRAGSIPARGTREDKFGEEPNLSFLYLAKSLFTKNISSIISFVPLVRYLVPSKLSFLGSTTIQAKDIYLETINFYTVALSS